MALEVFLRLCKNLSYTVKVELDMVGKLHRIIFFLHLNTGKLLVLYVLCYTARLPFCNDYIVSEMCVNIELSPKINMKTTQPLGP